MGKILPAHDHRAALLIMADMVIDILRGIGLVVHERTALAEAKVLDEYRIGFNVAVTPVGDLDPP